MILSNHDEVWLGYWNDGLIEEVEETFPNTMGYYEANKSEGQKLSND